MKPKTGLRMSIKLIKSLVKKKKTQITNISKKNGNLTRGSTNAEKDKKQQELPVTAGGSAQCYSHSGSQFGGFLQN